MDQDPYASPYSAPDPNAVVWTNPNAPLTAPVVSNITPSSLTVSFSFPSNPADTWYQAQASLTTDVTDPVNGFVPTGIPFPVLQGSGGTATVNYLAAGQPYFVRVCAMSNNPNGTPACSPPSQMTSTQFLPPPNPVEAVISASDPGTGYSSFTVTVPQNQSNTTSPAFVEVMFTTGTAPSSPVFVNLTGITPSNGSYAVPIVGSQLLPNTSYYNLTARFGASSLIEQNQDPYASLPSAPDTNPLNAAWTKPIPPANYPAVSNVTSSSFTASFYFPNNPSGTFYDVEAVPVNNTFAVPPSTSSPIQQGPPGTPSAPVPLTGLTSGTPYIVQVRALSNHDAQDPSGSYDELSPTTPPITTFINQGTITASSLTSLTATWALSQSALNNVASLQVTASNASGGFVAVSSGIVPSLQPLITVASLPLANASYTLQLQNFVPNASGGLTANNYAGGQVTGMTPAAIPYAPLLANGGTTTQLTITVKIQPDTNSPDSLYALQITPPTGSAGYLAGTSGGTPYNFLQSTPSWMTAGQWAANDANVLLNVPQNVTYQSSVLVQQKFPQQWLISTSTSILTPGVVTVTSIGQAGNSGVLVDGVLFGIPASGNITASFATPMDSSILTSSIVVESLQLGSRTPVTPTMNFGANTQTLLISYAWLPNTAYHIGVPAGLKDAYGFTTPQPADYYFLTGPDLSKPSDISPPLATIASVSSGNSSWRASTAAEVTAPNGSLSVHVDPGAIPAGGFVVPRSEFLSPAYPVTTGAPIAAGVDVSGDSVLQRAQPVEILIYRSIVDTPGAASLPPPGNADAPVYLTLTAPPNFAQQALVVQGIYALVNGAWVPVPGSTVNLGGNSVTAPITNSGVYALTGSLPTALNNSHAYPVPYKPSIDFNGITFKNLAVDSTIKIYTIMGELVKQLQNVGTNATVNWNPVTNSNGDPVASGVYIYQIKNPYSEKRGKLVIIR